MVVMRVRHDRGQWLLEQVPGGRLEARHAEARIDQQVPVTPAHMPDVAADQRIDMRLPDQRDVVIDPLELEPFVGNLETHAGSPPRRACGRA